METSRKPIAFIKYSKVWLSIAAVITILCAVMVGVWGLKLGIDFTGGSLVELSFASSTPATEQVMETLEKHDLKGSLVQRSGENKLILRTPFLTEDQHQMLVSDLRETFAATNGAVQEERFETIGAAVSSQLREKAFWAIILVLLGIILYVAYSFRIVSRPIASWKYGALAIVALMHDVLVVLGVFAVLGRFKGIEVDIGFVVALLTVLGYSVNDTIVVYDRIREKLQRHVPGTFSEIVNTGLNDTLMRSVNTTLTTLLPLFALYFVGGSSIHNFALALLIGIASGAYSSIFIASPLLVMVEKWQKRTA